MRKNKYGCFPIILLVFTLFNAACAQTTGRAYVNEENLVQTSTVLLNNGNYVVPIRTLTDQKIASIRFSNQYANEFDSLLNKYAKVSSFKSADYTGVKNINNLTTDLKLYTTLIVQLNEADLNSPQIIRFVLDNQSIKNVIVVLFGRGTSLAKLNEVTAPIICSERISAVSAFFCAQAVFGGVPITQKLTGTFTQRYRYGMGFSTEKIRLQYTAPEAVGINSDNLNDIDKIAHEALLAHATPGCVVLVVKDGKVIFNKAYGYHTYSPDMPDKVTDIFDVASMTKISATTIEAMKLYEQDKLGLDSTIGYYLPIAHNTNKNNILVRELLTHQAGLIPDIAGFEKISPVSRGRTIKINSPVTESGSQFYSADSSAAYPTKVANNYYLRKDYFKDVMLPEMLNSPLKTRGQYVYSDLSMCFMQQIAETITSVPLNAYVQQQFYDPLGMHTAGFLPLYRFKPEQIVPSEDDEEYRHSVLDGYVNDPTAALMGGVAGHAGLFASANDLAILYQMLLNGGTYGGETYFKPQTISLFTAKQSAVSRRGLGFDRWDPLTDRHYPSELASPQTYGHTGYTGTCVWVDPKYNLVYVFLSNRTYPKVSSKLSSLSIRPRIQDVVYRAIEKGL